ncbi:MAG: hypothetical protein ACM3PY_12310 [Omnitrophica WOR_2 bacterium]
MANHLIARNTGWLGWLFAGFNIALMVTGLALQIVTGMPLGGVSILLHFTEVIGLISFAIVGALIVSRHPTHPVGWTWLLVSVSFGSDHFAWGYASYGYVAHPGSLPGAEAAIVWLYWLGRGTLGILGMTLLLLLFPTGRPLSRGWGILAWIALVRALVAMPVSALAPDPIIYFPFPTDLLAASLPVRAVLSPIRVALGLVGLLGVAAALFSLLLRLIKSRGVERQQIKWFVYMASFLPPAFFGIALRGNLQASGVNFVFPIAIILALTATFGMSVANVIAIFRYRLWDIDLIIRRTLIYSVLTAVLALIYISSVVILQSLFEILIGNPQSGLVTVVSTLAIAALFVPLRRRLQSFIDRKFYRRKYDTERVLAAFSINLRNEVDLDSLTKSILNIAEETMQPVHLSLWLLEPSGEGWNWKET